MAYITKEESAVVRADLKEAFPELKFSVRIRDNTNHTVSIMAGPYDFVETRKKDPYREHFDEQMGAEEFIIKRDHFDVNHYHLDRSEIVNHKAILQKVVKIAMKNHWDKSDMMTDYFNCAFYFHLEVGQWNKPYVRTPAEDKPYPGKQYALTGKSDTPSIMRGDTWAESVVIE